jgi:hypothetical protein
MLEGLALPDRAGVGRAAMIRTCAKCHRAWASLASEETVILEHCPTCRTGKQPLSTLRAESKGEKRKAPPALLGDEA